MLEAVDVGERSLESYRGVAPDQILDAILRRAEDLRGARVVHINATPYGGGVSELLRSTVPLLCDLGIHAEWRIISGDERFFEVTKTIHNGLQGGARGLTAEDREIYLEATERNAVALEESADFVFVHDPQPAALLSVRGRDDARWIWRCHIDTSEPNPDVFGFLQPFLEPYDVGIFTMADFVPEGFPVRRIVTMPPAIDPLSPKNLELPEVLARRVLDWIGVRLERPLIAQVSRFDHWKDPMGVIEAYRLAREEVPGIELAMVGSMALDDPEGWDVYRHVRDAGDSDPLIHVFTNLTGVGNVEVNAFQRLSEIVVQKSIREGFGLVVSEALWKGTPVVAGRAGGIPMQMGEDGDELLVDDVEGCASAIVRLLRDPERARALGERGRRRVRERFLLPRLLLDELNLMADLAGDDLLDGGREASG